jgi:NADPH:quinone reductase
VRIIAAGVNFPDLLMTHGTYQYKPELPFVPGMEACGEIIEVAPDVSALQPGQRVAVNTRIGLYATEAAVPAAAVVPAPTAFTAVESACLLVAVRTARHALIDRANLQAGETMLVLGAGGGVGLAAVELGHLLGATVIAAASSDEKLQVARSRGATHSINYSSGDLVAQVRAITSEGVDVVFDPVGGNLFEQSLRIMGWGGRMLIVGFAAGRIGVAPANRPLINGFSLMGVRAGEAARRDPRIAERSAREIHAWTAAGHLRPHISTTFPLDQAGEALQCLAERRAIGRIALTME